MAYTTIKKPSDYFNTKLYTGNESTRSETGVGFQPDFTWIKVRSRADPHILTDAVRGTSSQLSSDTTGVQQTFSNMITSFDSDGFSLGANVDVNRNSETFASWNWKANGAGVANTDGSITSTVSANTTAGFSIVSYTSTGSNATIGHGLGVAPAMIIFKRRSGDTENWVVYHKSLGATKSVILNGSDVQATSSERFQDTSPTSTVFSVGTSGDVNGGSSPFIAYCFADVTGYSKFGSYNGNNNATDGAFIYTGFKPAFLIVKDSQSGQYWHMFDNKRELFNDDDFAQLSPNNSGSEATIRTDRGVAKLDFLSNGFKWRTDNSGFNGTNKYLYMCFAEAPLVGDNPCTAR